MAMMLVVTRIQARFPLQKRSSQELYQMRSSKAKSLRSRRLELDPDPTLLVSDPETILIFVPKNQTTFHYVMHLPAKTLRTRPASAVARRQAPALVVRVVHNAVG